MRNLLYLSIAVSLIFPYPMPLHAEPANNQSASLYLIDPPMATVDVPSIAVRGIGWGAYDTRQDPKAWLVDPDTQEFYELNVERNYRDCSFIKGDSLKGACILESDELFLRLEIPEQIKLLLTPKQYVLVVETAKNMQAGGVFTLIQKPSLTEQGPAIVTVPARGPVGATAMIFGKGFPKKQILDLRFDGVRLSLGGPLWPNDDGTFDNIPFPIPQSITRDTKTIAVTPGQHTIELQNGKTSAKTVFIVEGIEKNKAKEEKEEKERVKKEEERLKKEQEKIKKEEQRLEKERKTLEEKLMKKKRQEQKEKDEEDKARLERERKKIEDKLTKKKKEEQKKEKELKKINEKRENLQERFCNSSLPITFQPGCIQKETVRKKSEFEGQPCRADMAITFQSGCIAQRPLAYIKPFEGKPCNTDIPLVWQEGCIQEVKAPMKSEFEGKPCRTDIAITFQPGCISVQRDQAKNESQQSNGLACNPLIPKYSQSGCKE